MKFLKRKSVIAAKFILVIAMIAAICASSITAMAAGDLEMSTEFPGRNVKVGENVKVALNFVNNSAYGDRVNLSVIEAPEGWEWYFAGGDNLINAVYVRSGNNLLAADFYINVPETAKQGAYTVKLLAEGETLRSVLELTLTVSDATMGSSTMTTEYPRQSGKGGSEFGFYTTIKNNTLSSQSYSFSTDVPEGWDVKFMPADEVAVVGAIELDTGDSQKMYVSVKPPEDTVSGEYTVNVSATANTETLYTKYYLDITENYELELTTPDGRLSFDSVVNKETPVNLVVNNKSNSTVKNVKLSATLSTDWRVTFSESVIDSIEPGGSVEVTAYVTPAETALAGDYAAVFSASAEDATAETNFRVTVKTDTTWGLVGVMLILVIAAGLWFVFRKFGRR